MFGRELLEAIQESTESCFVLFCFFFGFVLFVCLFSFRSVESVSKGMTDLGAEVCRTTKMLS